MAALTTQVPTHQQQIPGWPRFAMQADTDITEGFFRNIPGPFESHAFADGQMKQEFGEVPQRVTYNPPLLIGVLPDSFVASNPPVCIRWGESDSAPLGSTPGVQAPIALADIFDELDSAGHPKEFTLVVAHNLNDQDSVFLGYCQPNSTFPLSDWINIPEIGFSNGGGGTAMDVSALLCADPTQANLSSVVLNFSHQ